MFKCTLACYDNEAKRLFKIGEIVTSEELPKGLEENFERLGPKRVVKAGKVSKNGK